MKTKVLIGIIVLLVPFLVKAEGKITKESLAKAYKELVECPPGEEEIVVLNYSIQDNNDVIFTISHVIDNTTTYDQYEEWMDGGQGEEGSIHREIFVFLRVAYTIVGRAMGIPYYYPEGYYFEVYLPHYDELQEYTIRDKSNTNYVIESGDTTYESPDGIIYIGENVFPNHAVEYAKAVHGSESFIIEDSAYKDTFSVSITPDVSDGNKYVINERLVVKSSKMLEGFDATENSFLEQDASNNSLGPLEDTNTTGEGESTKEEQVETKKDTSTIENPDTGLFLNIVGIIVILTVGLVIALKNKSIFKKI